jgi:hypothetical protein
MGCIPKGLNTVGVERSPIPESLLAAWYCSGKGGTGGTSGDICVGLVRGVPKFSNSAAAARPPSSVPEVVGRWSPLGNLCGGSPGDAMLSANELDGIERYEREKPALLLLNRLWLLGMETAASLIGGGVVSVELGSSCISEEPENPGEADEPSLSWMCDPSGGVELSVFMVTSTLAASRSWTC